MISKIALFALIILGTVSTMDMYGGQQSAGNEEQMYGGTADMGGAQGMEMGNGMGADYGGAQGAQYGEMEHAEDYGGAQAHQYEDQHQQMRGGHMNEQYGY